MDMAARHRARASSIRLMKVEVVPASKCRRPNITQFHVSKASELLPVANCCHFVLNYNSMATSL